MKMMTLHWFIFDLKSRINGIDVDPIPWCTPNTILYSEE